MKHLFYQVAASFAIAAVIVANTPAMIRRAINGEDHLERYFVVKQMEVEKFTKFGEWPTTYYDREVKRDFSADWTATVQKINADGTFEYFCSGSSHNEYKAGITLPQEKLTINWMVKEDPSCFKLPNTPGDYRIVVAWSNIDRGPYYLPTKYEYVTNVFRVLGEGEELNETATAK